ncbi:SLAP domain-containing protein [Lactobacillus helveticus]|uniref:aggregation-promoting factor n=1 Tax=Lactobacillus helveticus TaxID=1587 RepID=UPI001108BBE5|nr:SLAP domain-containing protein [Lactobacillus helveticus]TLQ22896.1 hypothetical protein FEZ38_03745 [Lactobacillus helveticus]
MKIKSILVKSIAVAAMSVTGLVVANNAGLQTAQAATVQNDAHVVTVNYVSDNSITVYNNYENPVATGQTLASNTSWKVIKTAYDSKGHKWYDLGKNQWIRAEYVTAGYVAANNATAKSTTTVSQAPAAQTQSQAATTSAKSYTSNATGSEASAKAWIASRESGGSYSASNGQYVGKYQLPSSYLNGDYSAANQERVADQYVQSRYGSWTAAKSFWQANGWY